MNRKQYDREWKQKARAENSTYAQKARESKNSEKSKARRKELRERPESKEKEKLYAREYRKRPEVKLKNQARHKAKWALLQGLLKRPGYCELCGCLDSGLSDGRTGLRMDHHKGYAPENWLEVQFICVKCDGKQLRKYA